MAEIRITPEGRQALAGQNPHHSAVVHGDQFINYGQAGSMGSHSTGTINYQSRWQSMEGKVDVTALVTELGTAIKEQSAVACSSADYQQLALLAQAKKQAEKHEGGKLIETLTKMGQSVLPVLAKAGAEGLVQWIEHKTGTKLS